MKLLAANRDESVGRVVARPAAGSATEFVVVCGLRVEEGIEAQVIRW